MTFAERVSLRFMLPSPLPESTHSILKQELFRNYRGTYAGKKKTGRAGDLEPELCAKANARTRPVDVAVNIVLGKLRALNGDHH